MKKVLIISPHYPPSNLAAVHRSRLFAQHLPLFEWEPIILTVDEKYYEEKLDWNLHKLLPSGQRIEKSKAFKVTKPRIIGDIGLRAFFQLYKKAKQIIEKEKIDFLYIPVPSFYTALIARLLNRSTGIKYGIDYIDPWVHYFPGSEKLFSRHWFSTQLAKFLEPIAIKKASLITGVAEGYYKGVIERNPGLGETCLFGAMPYGGDKRDHEEVLKLDIAPYLFASGSGKMRLVYAGAMLPKAYAPLENIFRSIAANRAMFDDVEFHFIGTGKRADDPASYNIKPLAEKYSLWDTMVFEYPQRIPYLDVLIHLKNADGVFILGSTEPHYTPSKIYQAVLSEKPVLAVLHAQSSAVTVIQQSKAGIVLAFNGEEELEKIYTTFFEIYAGFKNFAQTFIPSSIDQHIFERYSAKETTKQLAALFNQLT
jgi:hypothetical protein